MFKWNKKGMIFSPTITEHSWMQSHAQCPYPVDFEKFIRVYFSTRELDEGNQPRAFGGYVDLDKNNLKKIINVSSKPILQLGETGAFDEFGIMPCSVVKHNGQYYLYYAAWSRGVSVPYTWAIGFAISQDGSSFSKIGRGGPLLGATLYEPYLQGCPMVYKMSEHDWHMFYLSGIQWLDGENQKESQYLMMHATSEDGLNWKRDGKTIIDTVLEYESQTTGAILELHDKYHMFFSYRHSLDFRKTKGRGYLIGYASSDDLFTWHRDDSQVGIELSTSGWDSEMITYPHVAKINEKIIMFYCGNDFGREGFGYAELEI